MGDSRSAHLWRTRLAGVLAAILLALPALTGLAGPAPRAALAAPASGTVWGWGENSYGQLGTGATSLVESAPVQATGLSGVTALATGIYHNLALRQDGTVWAWGYNEFGQLGNGTTAHSSTPGPVSNLSGVTAIAAKGYYSLALKGDGTVWAWGYNSTGQLGNGSTAPSSTPVRVAGLDGVAAIAAGAAHGLAVLRSDGSVWAWGSNSAGQLGAQTTTICTYPTGQSPCSTSPVRVAGLSGVKAVTGGGSHSLALKQDGSAWGWGDNSRGQLGNGTRTDRSSPVRVSTLSGLTALTGGALHSLALR